MTTNLMDDLPGDALIINNNSGNIEKNSIHKNVILMDDVKNKIYDIRDSSEEKKSHTDSLKNI